MSTSGNLNLKSGGALVADIADLAATATEINRAADVSARVQELTATAAVTAGVQSLELNHASTIIAATIASTLNHPGSVRGEGHQCHRDGGSHGDYHHRYVERHQQNHHAERVERGVGRLLRFSAGNGTILVNVGSVALSG
jgi:hypothetical protein